MWDNGQSCFSLVCLTPWFRPLCKKKLSRCMHRSQSFNSRRGLHNYDNTLRCIKKKSDTCTASILSAAIIYLWRKLCSSLNKHHLVEKSRTFMYLENVRLFIFCLLQCRHGSLWMWCVNFPILIATTYCTRIGSYSIILYYLLDY